MQITKTSAVQYLALFGILRNRYFGTVRYFEFTLQQMGIYQSMYTQIDIYLYVFLKNHRLFSLVL